MKEKAKLQKSDKFASAAFLWTPRDREERADKQLQDPRGSPPEQQISPLEVELTFYSVCDLSPVGYSAGSVTTMRRITDTPDADSPLVLTDHHSNAVSSFLRLPPFRYSIYQRDTRLQETFSLLILPLKFPINPADRADTGILVEMPPYLSPFRAIVGLHPSWGLKHNYCFKEDFGEIN